MGLILYGIDYSHRIYLFIWTHLSSPSAIVKYLLFTSK